VLFYLKMAVKSECPSNINKLLPELKAAQIEDTHGMIESMESGYLEELVAATGCDEKALMYLWLLQKLSPGLLDGVQLTSQKLSKEPDWDDPSKVAQLKALRSRAIFLKDRFEKGEDVLKRMGVVASDSVSWLGRTGTEIKQSKLEREKEALGRLLTQQEIIQEWNNLRQQYCYAPAGPDGNIRLVWDFGVYMVNGSTPFEERYLLELISKPVDPELFDYFFQAGIKNGLFYKSSLHFAAVECLLASGNMQTVALAPQRLLQEGYTVAQMRQNVVGTTVPFTLEDLARKSSEQLVQPCLDKNFTENVLTSLMRTVLTTMPDTRMNR
jgi:hypothetical protein